MLKKVHKSKVLLSIALSTLLAVELALVPPTVQAAIEKENFNITDAKDNQIHKNPSYDEINEKLETIAKEMEIPSILLKVIAFRESSWRQFDSEGKPLLGANKAHPAIGIMQVNTYDDNDEETIERLKYDIEFNIRKGAELFDEKWQFTPRIGDGDRNKLENWYFAIWAYHIWAERNNPNVIAKALEEAENLEKDKDTENVSKPFLPKIAYQDSVLEICANPDGFLKRYIEPVKITKIPVDELPEEGIPSKTVKWKTPTPIHYGDLDEIDDVDDKDDKDTNDIDTNNKKDFTFTRLSGANRIDTAIQQALYGWPNGADAVLLARADNFPDALAGVPLAAKLDAPILLTQSDELHSDVKKALKALNPDKVYLLGSEGALGLNINKELKSLGWKKNEQVRLEGLNRYETAANIALDVAGNKRAKVVFIATGYNFTDALSIASIAGAQEIPMLLSDSQTLPKETKKALKELNPRKVYIIGNEEGVSSKVQKEIKTLLKLSTSKITRLEGNSHHDTMAAIIEHFAEETSGLSFATSKDFPDALAGAALAAKNNTILTLVPQISLDRYPALKTAIKKHPNKAQAESYIFGGTDAVSKEREEELLELITE